MSWPLIAGFALHWAWVYLVQFNGAYLLYPEVAGERELFFSASLIVFAIIPLCYGLFLEPVRTLFATPWQRVRNRTTAAILTSVGTILMALAGFAPAYVGPIAIVAGVLTGVGSAVLLMSYGVSFSVCDIATASTCTALGLFAATLAFSSLMLIGTAAPPVAALIAVLIPFGELACLNRCSRQLVDKLEFITLTIPVRTAPLAMRISLPCLVFGLVLGIARDRSIADCQTAGGIAFIAIFATSAAVCLLILGAMLFQRGTSNFMFRTLMPVAAACIALIALDGQMDAGVIVALHFGVYLIFEACMWVMAADLSQRFRISAFTVFGFSRGTLALGALFGHMAIASSSFSGAGADVGTLSVLIFTLIVLGTALLPSNAELRRCLKRGRWCPAFIAPDEYSVVNRESSPQDAAGRTFDSGESPLRHAPSMPEHPSERGAVERSPSAASPSPLPTGPTPPADGESEKRKQGRFKRKCAAVADRYLLSRKETEVLFLLAKGHNAAAIQETLFISAGTANTHMRHIYRKLDVHSQQELIRLVEGTDVRDWDE